MGVLHMAISPAGRFTSPKFARRVTPRPVTRSASGPNSIQQINSAPAPRGTLLPPQKPLEVKLDRTPEQEAAQEALAKLVRQCLAGDAQAWQQLVASQHRRIYAICYRFTGSV